MARFQIFAAPDGEGYMLDVQSDLFDSFKTRVVVPLLPKGATPPLIARLHPVFKVGADEYVLASHLLATVPREMLAEPRGDLASERDRIVAALDMLFQGF
ncbi:MAG: CcdB family protein [Mesorhizobium sp.]|nr:CcdB family protein [Mesorhizobium sp.]